MRVTFDPAARDELHDIFVWIAKDSPRAASEMMAPEMETGVMRLEIPELTHMGRPGLVEGTRELLEYPHIIVYKVFEERSEIVVLSVVHGTRDREGEES